MWRHCPHRRGTYRQDAVPGVQGGVLVPFDFTGVSSSGSSNLRLLPIKTWHSATVAIHGLFYEAGIPVRVPPSLSHTGGSRTHSNGCGIPWPGCRGGSRHISRYLCQDMGGTNAWMGEAAGQDCALFLWRILRADKAPPALWSLASAPVASFDSSAQKQMDLTAITQHHNEVGNLKHPLHWLPLMLESLNGWSAALVPRENQSHFQLLNMQKFPIHAEVLLHRDYKNTQWNLNLPLVTLGRQWGTGLWCELGQKGNTSVPADGQS